MKKFLLALMAMAMLCSVAFVGCTTNEDPNNGDGSDITQPGGDNPGGENPGGDNPGGENPGGENPGGEDPDDDKVAVESVTLSQTTAEITVGETLTLTATVLPANATNKTVTWKSDNGAVASVALGVVRARATGKATITATADGKTASCVVTVVAPPSDEEKVPGYIYYEDFDDRDEMPNYLTVRKSGSGNVALTDNGEMNISSGTSNAEAFVRYDFTEALPETYAFEARIMVTNDAGAFHNVLFLYNSAGTGVVTLAMEGGTFRNHSGGTWNNLNVPYEANVWYTIRIVLDCAENTYTLVIDDEVVMTDIPFRTADTDAAYFEIGGNKQNLGILYDYIAVREVFAPTLQVNETSKTLDLDAGQDEYTLSYTADSSVAEDPEITISCDKSSGFTRNGNVLTFTAAGVYTFTITASDWAGSVSEEVVVTVTSATQEAPEVTVTEQSKELVLQEGNTYTLQFSVTGSPLPEVTVTSDKPNGCVYDADTKTVTFFAAGQFTFTVAAKNAAGNDSEQIVVTVTDRYAKPSEIGDKTIWSEDFESDEDLNGQDGITVTKGGSGNVTFADGGMQIATSSDNSQTGKAFLDKAFESALSGIVVTEMTFSYAGPFGEIGSNGFINLLFFTDADAKTNTACFAVQYGILKGYVDGAWRAAQFAGYGVRLIQNEDYTIRLVNDFENGKSYLYLTGGAITLVNENDSVVIERQTLDGEVYLGSYNFRNPGTPAVNFRTGTDKTKVDYTVESIVMYQLLPDLTVNKSADTVTNLTDNAQYSLDYTAEEGATVKVEVKEASGITDGASVDTDNKTVTFTKAGTYTFTVTVSNAYGAISREIVVTVYEATIPATETMLSVDFTDTENRPSLPVAPEGSGALAEYTDAGLHFYSGETTGEIFYEHVFDAVVTGIVTTELTFSLSDTNANFINLLFYNAKDGNTPAMGWAVSGSGMIQHTPRAGSWISQMLNGETVYLQKGDAYTYTLKIVADFDNGVSYLYLLGSDIRLGSVDGETMTLPEEGLFIASNAFRWSTREPQKIAIGIDDQKNISYTVKSLEVYRNNVAVLVGADKLEKELLDETAEFDFASYVLGADAVTVSYDGADSESVKIEGSKVTITKAGTYELKLSAANDVGEAAEMTVTVIIKDETPVFSEVTEEVELTLFSDDENVSTTLTYQVSVGTVEITCDKQEGFTRDGNNVTFTAADTYVFTLTATNGAAESTVTITVKVKEGVPQEEVLSIDFTKVSQEDIAADIYLAGENYSYEVDSENGLTLNGITGTKSDDIFYQRTFDEALSGIVTFEITFSIPETNRAMVNLFFLFNKNFSGDPVANFAINNSTHLSYRGGSVGSWTDQKYNDEVVSLVATAEYTLKVIVDCDEKVMYVYLLGDKVLLGDAETEYGISEGGLYFGEYAFRTPATPIEALRIGIDGKSNAALVLKSVKVYENNAPVIAEAAADNAEVTLADGTASVQISATVLGADDFTVSCTQEGASVSGKTVTFTQEGEYTVTVTAQNEFGTVTKTVTVNVKAAAQTGE